MDEQKDVVLVAIDQITVDAKTRVRVNPETVQDYADAIDAGQELPPAILFEDGKGLHLSCGEHRLQAYRQLGRKEMPCVIRKGSRWDAILEGIQDNSKHGERITKADRQHNAGLVLREHPEWADRLVGKICGLHHTTIAKLRAKKEGTGELASCPSRTGVDGRARAVPVRVAANTATLPTASEKINALSQAQPGPMVDLKNCPECHGDWESDGHGERFCEDCGLPDPGNPPFYQDDKAETGESWDLPKVLDQNIQYTADGENGSFALIDPHPKAPGYFFVSVVRGSAAKGGQIDFTMRGLKAEPVEIRRILKMFGFVQTGAWMALAATGEVPSWIPPQTVRWQIEKEKLEYREEHGRWPELGSTAAERQLTSNQPDA